MFSHKSVLCLLVQCTFRNKMGILLGPCLCAFNSIPRHVEIKHANPNHFQTHGESEGETNLTGLMHAALQREKKMATLASTDGRYSMLFICETMA